MICVLLYEKWFNLIQNPQMFKIAIISASVRKGRNSHRVALYLNHLLSEKKEAEIELIDLKELNFPIFEERLKFMEDPDEKTIGFAESIKHADGVIIVTPEYNGGYPSSLKNVSDLLVEEWYRKPIAFATVSAGAFGGAQVITSLQFSFWKLQAWTVPAVFQVPNVEKSFDSEGVPADKEATERRATRFLDELFWAMELKK